MIEDLINKSIERRKSFGKDRPESLQPFTSPITSPSRGVPTLKSGIYKEYSPMLIERYGMFGRWTRATHGHWLSIVDMEKLWENHIDEDLLIRIKMNRIACEENWANDAAALFRPERLSLFAGDDNGNERVYLFWLDFEDEPEFWAYDSNGESRYKNLEEYLKAYLSDDLSASDRSWRA
jgi:hypothetical protein